MFDGDSNAPVPILGVRICPTTGRVVPVGGVKATSVGSQPIVPYDMYTDGLSGRAVRVHSAYVRDGQVRRSMLLCCSMLI